MDLCGALDMVDRSFLGGYKHTDWLVWSQGSPRFPESSRLVSAVGVLSCMWKRNRFLFVTPN